MKTISEMLRERDEERRRTRAMRDACNMAGLYLIAVLLAAAAAVACAAFLTTAQIIGAQADLGGLLK